MMVNTLVTLCLLNIVKNIGLKNCIHKNSAQNGDVLNFALGHSDLPNQVCGCIPGVNTYERCDHGNLVSADPSWHVPYSITFLSYGQMSNKNAFSKFETPILGTLVCLLNIPVSDISRR